MQKLIPWLLALLIGWTLARVESAPRATASGPPDFTPAVSAAEASVVHVATQVSARSRDEAVGSGFVLTPDGLIATSRHVLAGAQSVIVSVAGREPVRAQVVGTDDRVDVALLQAPLTGSNRRFFFCVASLSLSVEDLCRFPDVAAHLSRESRIA